MDKANSLKAEGTALYQAEKHVEAVSKYCAALSALEPEMNPEASELRRNLHSNISMLLLKTGDISGALESAESCISEDTEWAKGHYRKAAVLLEIAVEAAKEPSSTNPAPRIAASEALRKVSSLI